MECVRQFHPFFLVTLDDDICFLDVHKHEFHSAHALFSPDSSGSRNNRDQRLLRHQGKRRNEQVVPKTFGSRFERATNRHRFSDRPSPHGQPIRSRFCPPFVVVSSHVSHSNMFNRNIWSPTVLNIPFRRPSRWIFFCVSLFSIRSHRSVGICLPYLSHGLLPMVWLLLSFSNHS